MNRDYDILVNINHPLSNTYKPNDLVNVEGEKDFLFPMKISLVVYDSFLKLREELATHGFQLCINSGFRSYQMQQLYWHGYKAKYGLDYVKSYVAYPGTSEHQTGLAVDFAKKVNGRSVSLTEYEYQVLKDKAPKYNLILRYPENKSHITGIKPEAWHYRYVSNDALNEMLDHDLTLEEYTEQKETKVR